MLLTTLALFAIVSIVAVPMGAFLGWLIARTDTPGRGAFAIVSVAMLFMPVYLQAAAWESGFGQQGWFQLGFRGTTVAPLLHGFWGAAWVHALAALPWAVLLAAAHFRSRSSEHERNALTETSSWGVFRYLSIVEAIPAMLVALVLNLATVMSEVSVTDLFQVRTVAEQIYQGFAIDAQPLRVGFGPAAIVAAGLAASGCAIWWLSGCIRVLATWQERDHEAIRLGVARWFATGLLALTVLLQAGLPLGSLFFKAGVSVVEQDGSRTRHWEFAKAVNQMARAPSEYRAEFAWTLVMAHCASAGAMVVAGVAVSLAWKHPTLVGWLIVVGAAFCIAISGPLLGVLVIEMFNSVDSAFLAYLYSHTVLAPCVVLFAKCFPIVTLVVWTSVRAMNQDLLSDAQLQGASTWDCLRFVVIPWKWPALLAAWLLGMAAAVGELSGSILTVPPGVTTLAIRIFGLVHYGVEDRLAGLCLASIGGVVVLLVLGGLMIQWNVRRHRLRVSEGQARQS